MGVIFHRYQSETPETWRPEGSRSYIAASPCLFWRRLALPACSRLVVRFKVGIFAVGFQGSFYFAICIWGALALAILLESVIFVRLHRLVVIGWLTTSVLACAIIWWWLRQ
jgi:hypothetical protein